MLSNKSSLQNTQKFHLKTTENKSMMNLNLNLNNAIKQSNVKNFVKKGLVVSKQNQQLNDDGDVDLKQHLLQLKKSCSELSRQLKNKEIQSNRMRDESLITQQKSKKIRNQRQLLQDKISQLQKNIQNVSIKRENADHFSKTFQHILERMRKDDIHKQLQKNQLQRQLRTLQKSKMITQVQHYSTSQFQKLSVIGLKDAQNQFNLQKSLRKNNLNSINKQSSKKMSKQVKLNERQKQTNQIQELAACDIQDADLLRLKKFLTVQVFLRNLLKSKMFKIKKYYQSYENAFFQIKSNTSVKDANSLKSQFFNFQDNYNQKIIWVKHLEQQTQQSQKQKRQLQQKLSKLRAIQMQNIQKLQQLHQQKPKENLRQLNSKSLEFELSWERIQSWIKVQAKKMKIQCEDMEKCFKEILKQINQEQKVEKQSKQDNQVHNLKPTCQQKDKQIIETLAEDAQTVRSKVQVHV